MLTNRDIIIVEDIVDSGLSIKFIEELMRKENPASVKVVPCWLSQIVLDIM